MPKLKEVLSTEVHWQIADWHTRDQANIRIRQLMGDDARFFAPVYVTHSGYYWADADPESWTLLSDAGSDDTAKAYAIIERLKSAVLARYPQQQQRIDRIFTRPNDDFVFIRHAADGSLDLRMTGWGFANFHRAYGGSIVDVPSDDKLRPVSLAFSIDGRRVPDRKFSLWRSTSWVDLSTDLSGLYSLGLLAPATQVQVRDTATGIERIETVGEDTSVIDIDVTEFITVRISARHDGVPLEDDDADVTYGHRNVHLTLHQGVAECRLPWLEGVDCTVSVREQSQTRPLDKNIVNVFNFESVTPQIPHTEVTVRVHADGNPVADEPVTLRSGKDTISLNTDVNGEARAMFDTPDAAGAEVSASVRDAVASKPLDAGPVVFDFNFDTTEREEFMANILVVDADEKPVPGYPIQVGIDPEKTDYITDPEGRVDIGRVYGGDVMTVRDGNDLSYSQTYTLNAKQPQYVFRLPYSTSPSDNDYTLRVIEIDGNPASGVTCVLSQEGFRVLGHLDNNGEMHFSSADFQVGRDVNVDLYSERRKFPKLSFELLEDEKEYELVEVKGPYPWWKIALEVGALFLSIFALFATSAAWYGIFDSLPLIFR